MKEYRFSGKKISVTVKFPQGESAPSIEEALEKILIGRMN